MFHKDKIIIFSLKIHFLPQIFHVQVNPTITSLKTELCYHVEVDVSKGVFGDDKVAILQWILKEPQQVNLLSRTSVWDSAVTNGQEFIIEIGPRFVYIIDNYNYVHNTTDKHRIRKKNN